MDMPLTEPLTEQAPLPAAAPRSAALRTPAVRHRARQAPENRHVFTRREVAKARVHVHHGVELSREPQMPHVFQDEAEVVPVSPTPSRLGDHGP